MKLPLWVLSLLLVLAANAYADEFTTSHGEHYVPPVSSLLDESNARQAAQSAQVALAELLVDSATLDREGFALQKEVGGLEQKQKDELSTLGKLKAELDASNKKYLEALAKYEERRAAHESDALNQRDEAARLTNLPSAQRDRAMVDRLQKWASEIESRKVGLDADRTALLQEHDAVESQKQAASKAEAAAGSELRAARDALLARLAANRAGQASVFKQLDQCLKYIREVQSELSEKFKATMITSPTVLRAEGRLKLLQMRRSKPS